MSIRSAVQTRLEEIFGDEPMEAYLPGGPITAFITRENLVRVIEVPHIQGPERSMKEQQDRGIELVRALFGPLEEMPLLLGMECNTYAVAIANKRLKDGR